MEDPAPALTMSHTLQPGNQVASVMFLHPKCPHMLTREWSPPLSPLRLGAYVFLVLMRQGNNTPTVRTRG